MWFKKGNNEAGTTETESRSPGGIDYEAAADRVTAAVDEVLDTDEAEGFIEETPAPAAEQEEQLIIKPEWAQAALKACFYPPAKMVHPAYALTDEEAEKVSPKMAAFLQALADKYAPAMVCRLANKYPEFWDLAGALGVLYYQKWRIVSKLQAEEARARAEAGENARRVPGVRVMSTPAPTAAAEPTADGAIVI